MDEETSMFDVNELRNENIKQVINEVFDILEERGYNAYNQITGYLISGDPGYISSYKSARSKILQLDRSEISKMLLEELLKKK